MGWGGVTDLDINKTFGCSSAGTGRLAGWEEAASPTRRPHTPTTRVMCGDNSTVWVEWGGGRGAGASETGVLLSGGGVGGRADGLAVPLGAAHHLRLRPGTKINQHIVRKAPS